MKHYCTLSSATTIKPKGSKWKLLIVTIKRFYREIKQIICSSKESSDSLSYISSIKNNPQKYPLFYQFLSNPDVFYEEKFSTLISSIVREKRLIIFETPNRAKITHEYDIEAKDCNKDEDILFLFLPKKRLSWLKIYVDGQRLVVAKSSMVEQKVRDVFKKELQFLSEDSHNNVEDIWSSIWKYSQSIPCFIYKSDILQKEAIIELEYYDSIHIKKKNRWGYLYPIDNRDIEYDYYPDKQHNSWLYVKSPEKFTIQVSNTPNTNYDVEFNSDDMDPEVVSCTIKPNNLQNNSSAVKFHIHIKVPRSLKFWYIVLYCLCISYILFIAVRIRCKLLDCQRVPDIIMEHNDAVLTIGVSIIALIIATRGWLVKEETILKRLLIFLSIMMGLISILLIVHTFTFRC